MRSPSYCYSNDVTIPLLSAERHQSQINFLCPQRWFRRCQEICIPSHFHHAIKVEPSHSNIPLERLQRPLDSRKKKRQKKNDYHDIKLGAWKSKVQIKQSKGMARTQGSPDLILSLYIVHPSFLTCLIIIFGERTESEWGSACHQKVHKIWIALGGLDKTWSIYSVLYELRAIININSMSISDSLPATEELVSLIPT
jgi:hypothetical protein